MNDQPPRGHGPPPDRERQEPTQYASVKELIAATQKEYVDLDRPSEDRINAEKRAKRGFAAVLSLLFVAAGLFLVFGGGSTYSVTAEFENASQLVPGNEVIVGGLAAGSVSSVELGPDGQALVTFTVEEDFAPLPRGTVAQVRSYSLSGIANRQISLQIPAPSMAGAAIEDGGVLSQSETISEVDLDEIFNTLDDETVEDFKKVIQGFEASYEGVGPQANKGFHYLNPFLSTSRRLFAELTRDEIDLEDLIVDTAQLSGALAERAPDVSALIGNLDQMMGALAAERTALAESIAGLPDFMRQANTTFTNLRFALDDVDPLVAASKPAAERLEPFLASLRVLAEDAVPTVRDLDQIISSPGEGNDLIELTDLQIPLAAAAIGSGSPDCGPYPSNSYTAAADDDYEQGSFGESVCALTNGLESLSWFRAYTPELLGWFNDFADSGVEDATGGMGRINLTFNAFIASAGGLPQLLGPVLDQANALTTDQLRRCPGANERPIGDSELFTENGTLACDPSQIPPGP